MKKVFGFHTGSECECAISSEISFRIRSESMFTTTGHHYWMSLIKISLERVLYSLSIEIVKQASFAHNFIFKNGNPLAFPFMWI